MGVKQLFHEQNARNFLKLKQALRFYPDDSEEHGFSPGFGFIKG